MYIGPEKGWIQWHYLSDHAWPIYHVSSLTRVTSVKSANPERLTHWLTSILERQVTLKMDCSTSPGNKIHKASGHWDLINYIPISLWVTIFDDNVRSRVMALAQQLRNSQRRSTKTGVKSKYTRSIFLINLVKSRTIFNSECFNQPSMHNRNTRRNFLQ